MINILDEFYNKSSHKKYFKKLFLYSLIAVIIFTIIFSVLSYCYKNTIFLTIYILLSTIMYLITLFLNINYNKYDIIKNDKQILIDYLKEINWYNNNKILLLINSCNQIASKPSIWSLTNNSITFFGILSVVSVINSKDSISISIFIYVLLQNIIFFRQLFKISVDYEYIGKLLDNIYIGYTEKPKIIQLIYNFFN